MPYENLLYEVEGSLALITINRPERHNAISLATLDDLHAAIAEAADDETVRVIAITGAGDKAFASGSDLARKSNTETWPSRSLRWCKGVAERLERTPKATIAAINGYCMGGGLEVALGCDLRIATPGSKFATPEGRIGIIPGGGATQRLPRLIGRAWAMEMLLMGETIDAKRALEIGLITRLVEAEELMPTVRKMAEKLAAYAPFVPQFMKAMVHYGMEGSMTAGLALEKFAQGALCETEDKAEGLRAFLEKRNPNGRADELSLEVAGVLETCIYAEDLDARSLFTAPFWASKPSRKRRAATFSSTAGRMRFSSYSIRRATSRPDVKLGVPTHGAATGARDILHTRGRDGRLAGASGGTRGGHRAGSRLARRGALHLFQGPGGEQRGNRFSAHLAASGAVINHKSLLMLML